MSPGNPTCKEVTSNCKCIVKERRMPNPNNGDDCQATIVGVINLPKELCKGGGGDSKDCCKEVFRDLGECLQKSIVKVSRDHGCDGSGRRRRLSDDFC